MEGFVLSRLSTPLFGEVVVVMLFDQSVGAVLFLFKCRVSLELPVIGCHEMLLLFSFEALNLFLLTLPLVVGV